MSLNPGGLDPRIAILHARIPDNHADHALLGLLGESLAVIGSVPRGDEIRETRDDVTTVLVASAQASAS